MEAQTTAPRTPRAAIALYYITYTLVIGIIAVALFLAWPALVAEFQARMSTPPALPQSTAAVARPAPNSQLLPPISRPAPAIPGIAQNEATAQAMYDAAVAAPVPNVDTTGESAPPVLMSKPVDRQSAPDIVPTAEPRTESSGIFGSKPAIVNPQETHECRHGQVWTERGCKNPTPER